MRNETRFYQVTGACVVILLILVGHYLTMAQDENRFLKKIITHKDSLLKDEQKIIIEQNKIIDSINGIYCPTRESMIEWLKKNSRKINL